MYERERERMVIIIIIMSKGEFYIGGFVLLKFIEPFTFVHCVLPTLNKLQQYKPA